MFILRRGIAAQPVAEFLWEPVAMGFEWSADASLARRFGSKAEAERFGRNFLAGAFHVIQA